MYVPDSTLLPKLRQFVSNFVGHPALALVDVETDPTMLLGAMRSGASQVVPLPIQPHDFKAAMDCVALQYGHGITRNNAICVTGVTGGCGATTLAVNLANEIAAQHDRHVILTELSMQIGKLAAYLDLNPHHTTSDLLKDGERIDPQMVQAALSRVGERFEVLVGEYRAITPISPSSASVIRLVDYCRSLCSAAVFDVPCTFDEVYFETLAIADQIVLVGEQKIPSIRTLKLLCESLSQLEGPRKLHIVINRYDPRMPGFGADRLKSLLDVENVLTVCNDYASVMASINHGRPLRQEAPRSPALADINTVVQALLRADDRPAVDRRRRTQAVNGRGISTLFQRIGLFA
jgi:pilus assembly protein CpaE